MTLFKRGPIYVGVTGNAKRFSPSWWCSAFALRLVSARPVRLSTRHGPGKHPFSALIIGGGDDINPEHYGGDKDVKARIDVKRDQMEIDWIQWALEHNIPMLGICRGAQLINVVQGGSLHQDIRPMRVNTHNRRGILATKRVTIQADSLLKSVIHKSTVKVNSLHHQAVDDTGTDLKAVAWDNDHIIQAIESTDKRIIGVQWHPEYLFYLPSQLALFKNLIQRAYNRRYQ